MANIKLRQWQKELDQLTEETGTSLEDICGYLGLSYNRDIGFYVKLPKKRRMYIGIGMALRQPVDVINQWIIRYGTKRRLYSKDISEDLIWIYLIHKNEIAEDRSVNYFELYEECQLLAYETYLTLWDGIIREQQSTTDVDKSLAEIKFTENLKDLEKFVMNHMDAFQTAYSKPRRMLAEYVGAILDTNGRGTGAGKPDSLSSLRGWLDDSMINYLSGSIYTINVNDMKTGARRPELKHVPKNKRSHISLALSLGMTREGIDRYLELMGYLPLDEDDPDEDMLIWMLGIWDEEHPLQRRYKDKYFGGEDVDMELEDELQAVSDMLMLRQDLKEEYKRRKMDFPYIKY